MRHREHEFAMTNEAMLAEFMARVSQVADVMDQKQPGQPEAAAKLREAVEDLRDVSSNESDAGVLAVSGLQCTRVKSACWWIARSLANPQYGTAYGTSPILHDLLN